MAFGNKDEFIKGSEKRKTKQPFAIILTTLITSNSLMTKIVLSAIKYSTSSQLTFVMNAGEKNRSSAIRLVMSFWFWQPIRKLIPREEDSLIACGIFLPITSIRILSVARIFA
jgi:hypothetical protein